MKISLEGKRQLINSTMFVSSIGIWSYAYFLTTGWKRFVFSIIGMTLFISAFVLTEKWSKEDSKK